MNLQLLTLVAPGLRLRRAPAAMALQLAATPVARSLQLALLVARDLTLPITLPPVVDFDPADFSPTDFSTT